MKKNRYKILFSIVLFFCLNTFLAQVEDGKYTYQNEKGMTCHVTISEGGWKAAVVLNLGKSYNGKVIKVRGDWFKVNKNGMEPDYSGPEGWYQVGDGNCSMEFDGPGNELTLKIYECSKSGLKDMEVKFIKK